MAAPSGFGDISPYAAPIAKALEDALSDIEKLYPKEIPPWKEVHRNYFPHLSQASVFETAKWIPTPGNQASVNPGTADWKEGYYSQKPGASLRLLVEMSSPPTAYFVLPGKDKDDEKHDLSGARLALEEMAGLPV